MGWHLRPRRGPARGCAAEPHHGSDCLCCRQVRPGEGNGAILAGRSGGACDVASGAPHSPGPWDAKEKQRQHPLSQTPLARADPSSLDTNAMESTRHRQPGAQNHNREGICPGSGADPSGGLGFSVRKWSFQVRLVRGDDWPGGRRAHGQWLRHSTQQGEAGGWPSNSDGRRGTGELRAFARE